MKLPARYHLKGMLGQGGAALVYEVEDQVTGEHYALKMARSNLSQQFQFRVRWQREVTLHTRLVHPNIVPLIDAGVFEDGTPYLIMGLATGGTLEERLKKGASVRQILLWTVDVLSGLGYLHANGILHQDFKGENALITDDNRVWLIDFSVARSWVELREDPQQITGTMGWIAPEQQLKKAHYICRATDLYPVGKLLELLALQLDDTLLLQPLIDSLCAIHPMARPKLAWDAAEQIRILLGSASSSWLEQVVCIKHLPPPLPHAKEVFEKVLRDSIPMRSQVPDVSAITVSSWWSAPIHLNPKLIVQRELPTIWPVQEQLILKAAKSVVETQSPKVILLFGPDGIGKSQLIRKVAQRLEVSGLMESIQLNYSQGGIQGGIHEVIQEEVFPWGASTQSIINRLKQRLQVEHCIPEQQAQKEAEALAKWCGVSEGEENERDPSAGLVYLYQKLESKIGRSGTLLQMFNPEHAQLIGDGFRICEAILSKRTGNSPVLVLAAIDSEKANAETFQELAYLNSLGAQILEFTEVSQKSMRRLLTSFYQINPSISERVIEFAKGRLSIAVMLLRSWAIQELLHNNDGALSLQIPINEAFPEQLEHLYVRRLEPMLINPEDLNKRNENKSSLFQVLVNVALLKVAPTERLLTIENREGLERALRLGLLHHHGIKIAFSATELKSFILEHVHRWVDLTKYHRKLAALLEQAPQKSGLEWKTAIALHLFDAGLHAKAAEQLVILSQKYHSSGREDTSIYLAKKGLTASRSVFNGSLESKALLLLGKNYIAKNNPKEAWKWLQKLMPSDEVSRARALVLQSQIPRFYSFAFAYLQEASSIFLEHDLKEEAAFAQTILGNKMLNQNKITEAEEIFSSALRHAHLGNGIWRKAKQGLVVALLRQDKDVSEQLSVFFKEAQRLGSMTALANSAFLYGLWRLRCRNWIKAEKELQRSLRLATTGGLEEIQGDSLSQLAATKAFLGKLVEAREAHRQAYALFKARGLQRKLWISQLQWVALFLLDAPLDRFKEHMDRLSPPQDVAVQLWWCLFQAIRCASITDRLGTQKWWEKAKKNDLNLYWDLNVCFVLQALFRYARPHSPQIVFEIKRELGRIYGTLTDK